MTIGYNPRCCGSASPVLPSCHQLDGLWTVTRSSRLASPGAADPRVRRMCGKFLHAAAAVLTDASVMLRSRIYGDSHGLNGALQVVLLDETRHAITFDGDSKQFPIICQLDDSFTSCRSVWRCMIAA